MIAVALALFMVFSACMSWARQYLVLHTGNRIDAALGSCACSSTCSGCRRAISSTGPPARMVARLHGVETIREFLSGAAVTLILDVPFLFDVPGDDVLVQRGSSPLIALGLIDA